MPVYCSRAVASIALSAGKLGYSLHGHDVWIRVCIKTRSVVDISWFSGLVRDTVSRYDHTLLDDVLGDGALIEDLLFNVLNSIRESISKEKIELLDAWCEASIPDGDIIVSIGELA
ncbi:MAG: hypothetical protein F7C38_04560 [Desulfurococcales archaeon]|nr:hypothetical protein [Desulfurococcales archaeon]